MKKLLLILISACLLLPLVSQTALAGDTSGYPSLKEFYADYFDFGSSMSGNEARNAGHASLYVSQYAIITPENELKPASVIDEYASAKASQENQGSVAVHFNAANPILDFARTNGIKVNGHVLFWHNQTPDSFFRESYSSSKPYVSREVMLERMENYVRLVMEYLDENYPGLIVSWDVVNEAINDSNGGMRQSKYTEIVGDDWVVQAFRFARKYAPEGTLLVYNEYSVPYQPKLTGVLALLDQLLAENLVDVCGVQAHYQLTTPSKTQFRLALRKITEKGLLVRISEMDILVDSKSDSQFQLQADRYEELMKVILEFSDSVIAVQTWGSFDNLSWKSASYPLLFDRDGKAKPAFYALTDPGILP